MSRPSAGPRERSNKEITKKLRSLSWTNPPSPPLERQRIASPTNNMRNPSVSSPPGTSRAERFEDEKRRIIESCFSKLDANGQLAESYITHIKILEDAQHPSSPPPPESSPENKKPRLIIIAVRSTGRVRMHKARENNNGSFSIGKTWNLEELSAIESFGATSVPPKDERARSFREWAGSVGFTVTITKPYYWQAGTSKEKDFFIASAVKIYRKYTKGQVPELKGFDEKDKALMLGAPPTQQQPQSLPPAQRVQNRDVSGGSAAPPQPPFAHRDQSRDTSRYRQSPGPPPSIHDPNDQIRPGSAAASRQHSQSPAPSRLGPNQPPGPRAFASQEQMRAGSREGYRNDHRPGTSPGPGYGRSPAPQQQGLPPPSVPYAQSRSESPSVSSIASSRDTTPKVQQRQQSPARQRSYQQSVESVSEDRQVDTAPPPQVNGGSTGANLFQTTRQRWMGQQQPQPSPNSAPQLPPIETTQPFQANDDRTPVERQPMTAVSEASSAGIDLGDAAAINALTSYWGPEPTPVTTPQQLVIQEPSSPPTPERSRLRPSIGTRDHSEASFDLRPPPLKQGGRTPDESASQYGTPRETGSAVATPRGEEPPAIKPLSVQNKRASLEAGPKLAMPGGFDVSPLSTPAETPTEERTEEQAQQRQVEREAGDQFRPGLGPMFKKRTEVANKFKKAAAAANAFKPRPGGAAEKILKAKAEREAGVGNSGEIIDGVSGFVPRPTTARQESGASSVAPTSPKKTEDLAVKEPVGLGVTGVREEQVPTPKVAVSSPISPTRVSDSPGIMDSKQHQPVQLTDGQRTPHEQLHLQTPEQQQQHDAEAEAEAEAEQALFEQREVRKPQVKVKRRSNQQERNLAALGIDRSLLEGKGLDFEAVLVDFGWNDAALEPKKLADIEVDLRREQGRLEAGSWLNSTDAHREEKVQQVEILLDKTIQECDELEGLLTLYSVELGSLNDDIAFIEAQSQGLQVQSANQKLLHRELEGLVETMNLDKRVLELLRYGDLGDMAGLEQVEGSVARLYQAMVTIDPSIRSAGFGGRPKSKSGLGGEGASEVSGMKALREKREVYGREGTAFCQRLMQHLDYTFTAALGDVKARAMRPASGGTKRLHKEVFAEARRGLWPYAPLIMFTKEMNLPAWQTALRMYYSKAQPVYADAFKDNLSGWKRAARKPTADEADLLFTATEKDDAASGGGSGGLAAARKLTVKRSQTLAKTLRTASGGNRSPTETRHPGQLMSSEVFAGAMDEMAPLISQEQNFVVELFHAGSLETTDFLEAINQAPPDQRHGMNLLAPRPMDTDREMAKRVTGIMDEVFGFFAQETGTLLEWCVGADPIQGVGVMACLSKHSYYLRESSQEFLVQLLEGLISRLQSLWAKFVDEQVRAIEDTKVKIKKRKGVIGFIKVFPHFSAAVENVFSAVAREDYEGPANSMFEVRQLVDDAYRRINRAMFDSLKVIAKESPSAPQQQAKPGDDSEDKEMLNFHILLIENMNHYIEGVDDGGKEGVLAEWKGRALMERMEALEGYVGRVIRRPLGKLLDFLDSTESLLTSHPTNPTAIASRPSYSRKAARNLLSQYDSKEIRRGIDTLRKRIEKHFGDADEEALSQKLVGFVCKECERSYERTIDRTERIIMEVYPASEGEKVVELDFAKADVQAGFRR